MNSFDVLIVGGGAAGMSCALVLGSAKSKPFAADKKIGIVMHQKKSALAKGIFNNVLGIKQGTSGWEILEKGKQQLAETYPHVVQIGDEKVIEIKGDAGNFTVVTDKNKYQAKTIVIAVGPSRLFNIEGLNQYVQAHGKLPVAKKRIELKNTNQKIKEGIYVAGILAGWISQFSIAAGSGALVATDILKIWNDGSPTVIHD